jgi:thermitase
MLACCAALPGLGAPDIHALEVRLAADTLTVHADQAPLSDILAKLEESGVRVAMDDRINPVITANFANRETGEGIKRLLADCDYALSWKTIAGPAGKLRRLDEVLVYKPGDRRTLKPRPAPSPAIAETRAATHSITCLKGELLLRLKAGTTPEQFRALLLKTGAMILDGIPALGIYRLRLPPDADLAAALSALAGDPSVGRVEPNQIYRPITSTRTGDSRAGDPSARPVASSSGPAVAVLDSGFTMNAALEKAVIASLDATAPGQAITDPLGHGTQMAYLASGSIAPFGTEVAPSSVSIIPIRTLDDNGLTSNFSLMQSMVFALENGARVISMSWGSTHDSGFFDDAVAYASQHGAALVAAAGNEPTGQALYPAALPGVLAVAALTADGNVWDQSNYGPFVKLAAPGFADFPVGYKGPPGSYGGTSIAAAFTANIIAQYLSIHPKATADEAVAALTRTLVTVPAGPGALHSEIPRLNNAAIATFLK